MMFNVGVISLVVLWDLPFGAQEKKRRFVCLCLSLPKFA